MRLLRQSDAQLFNGYLNYPSLTDGCILDTIESVAQRVSHALSVRGGRVVLSGCGTSGRLAFLCARSFNRLWRQQQQQQQRLFFPALFSTGETKTDDVFSVSFSSSSPSSSSSSSSSVNAGTDTLTAAVSNSAVCGGGGPFVYLLAGGDAALVTSQELTEDDPSQGAEDLAVILSSVPKVGDLIVSHYITLANRSVLLLPKECPVVLVGITCGLSAPYVAGQLRACQHAPNVTATVLIGFNPSEDARDVPIEKGGFTFREVVEECAWRHAHAQSPSASPFFLLNPVVGPVRSRVFRSSLSFFLSFHFCDVYSDRSLQFFFSFDASFFSLCLCLSFFVCACLRVRVCVCVCVYVCVCMCVCVLFSHTRRRRSRVRRG